MKRKAIFFDRDGIVNVRLIDDYVKNVQEFALMDDFPQLFSAARDNGYLCIVVSNQQGVGKGIMSRADLDVITDIMQLQVFAHTNSTFDDVLYCTDLAGTSSLHRKPQPGMLLDAIEKYNINPTLSWMIGDSLSDAQAAYNAGVPAILVGTFDLTNVPDGTHIVRELSDCVPLISNS